MSERVRIQVSGIVLGSNFGSEFAKLDLSICRVGGHHVVVDTGANGRDENQLSRTFEHGPFVRRSFKSALSAPRDQL